MRVEHADASRIRRVIDVDIASCGRRSGDLSPPTARSRRALNKEACWGGKSADKAVSSAMSRT